MLPFEFVIDGPPVSSQTNNRKNLRKWRKELKNKAKSHWQKNKPPVGDSVMVEITYFYEKGPPKIDVDNMSKPILYQSDLKILHFVKGYAMVYAMSNSHVYIPLLGRHIHAKSHTDSRRDKQP